MKHSVSHEAKTLPIRWGAVTKVVLTAFAVLLVAVVVWYVAKIALPAYRQAREDQAFESFQVQFLTERVSAMERFIHLPNNP